MGGGGYAHLCRISSVLLGLFHETGGGVYAGSWSPSPVARKQRPCCLYRLGGCGFCEDGGGVLPFVLVVLRLHLWEGVCPPRTAVVVSPPRCGIPSRLRMVPVQRGRRWCSRRFVVGFPSCSQMVSVQRGRQWCSRHLCWPTAGVAGLLQGCAGSEDGGGYLAASCSVPAMRLTLRGGRRVLLAAHPAWLLMSCSQGQEGVGQWLGECACGGVTHLAPVSSLSLLVGSLLAPWGGWLAPV